MLGASDPDDVAGMRAMIRCVECETAIAGVDTVHERAAVETPVDDCPDHPDADYSLSIERLRP